MPTTAKSQKLASFNIEVDDWEQFKVLARENHTNASRLLQGFVREYIGKLPEPRYEVYNQAISPGKIIQIEKAIAQLTQEVAELKKAG